MYEKNGIVYAETPLLSVKRVRPLPDHRLLLLFSNGEERIADCSSLLDGLVFSDLKSEEQFAQVYLEHGVPTWLDGAVDIAPEWLYEMGMFIRDGMPN
jgi:hypothetical protein